MNSDDVRKKRVHVYLSGRVQGVGFRNFTRRQAAKLGVNGWVKNLSDGRVEAVLTGEEEQVNQMLDRLKEGPSVARVDEIEYKEEEYKEGGFDEFEIVV